MPALMQPPDAMFLLAEGREKPLHVGGLQLFEPPADAGPDYVQEIYEGAIQDGEVHPRLARRPVRGLTTGMAWAWQDDPNLDLLYHVRHSALPHPGRIRELLVLVSRLHGTLLDRTRPLWETHIIEGLEDGRFAVYTKVHHALVDGVAAMKMLEKALSPDPDARDVRPPWTPRAPDRDEPRRDTGLLTEAVGAVRGAVEGVRSVGDAGFAGARALVKGLTEQAAMLPYQAPRSVLNVPISGARRFAADKWSLEKVKRIGKHLDGTVNDVVMAMTAGALRRYLLDQDALPDKPLVAMVPVSLRTRGSDAEGGGNAVGVLLANLATHLADPQERYELIQRSVKEGKISLEGLSPEAVMLLSAATFAPLGLGPLYRFEPLRRPPFNVVISNVPGPQEPLYWNGARMTETYPVSIPYDGQALNITVSSYTDHLQVGLIGCRRAVPSLQRMLGHLDESLDELAEVAGI